MGTAIKHPVPDGVKPSFVIFDGLTENDGHENDGPNFRTFPRHEIAGHEIAGQ